MPRLGICPSCRRKGAAPASSAGIFRHSESSPPDNAWGVIVSQGAGMPTRTGGMQDSSIGARSIGRSPVRAPGRTSWRASRRVRYWRNFMKTASSCQSKSLIGMSARRRERCMAQPPRISAAAASGRRPGAMVARTQASGPKLTETLTPALLTDTGARVTPASGS